MNIYEFIGVLIGDGYIRHNSKRRVYQIEIAGNVDEDYEYFIKISEFVQKITSRKPTIRIKKEKTWKSLRLEINNKNFIEYLFRLGLPEGNKTFTISIPEKFLDWKYSRHIIRGILETDGCIYFSKSKKIEYPSYPRIEIKTSSKKLKSQIMEILNKKGFKVYCRKCENTYSLTLSGEKMLKKWIDEIGLSNKRNISKYDFWKKKGFYIPHISLKSRLETCADGTAANAVGCNPTIQGFESPSALFIIKNGFTKIQKE